MTSRWSWITPQFIVGLFCGGLGGAVFTYWVNRPTPTILTYSVATTTIGTDGAVKNVIPNLKLYMGSEEIDVVHTHVIEFVAQRGPQLDSVNVALGFQGSLQVYGMLSEKPSALHHIDCKSAEAESAVVCTMKPVAPRPPNRYRVIVAVNQKDLSLINTTTDRVELVKAEDFLARETHALAMARLLFVLVLVLAPVLTIGIVYYLRKRRVKTLPRIHIPMPDVTLDDQS